MWHASIAAHDPTGPLEWRRLGIRDREAVRMLVMSLLQGVGAGDTRRDRSGYVLHARRRLADAELALLTSAWCAIPAVAIAGDGIPW